MPAPLLRELVYISSKLRALARRLDMIEKRLTKLGGSDRMAGMPIDARSETERETGMLQTGPGALQLQFPLGGLLSADQDS